MSKVHFIPANHGFYAASMSLYEDVKEYRVVWHPVVAWKVTVHDDGEHMTEPVVVADEFGWGKNEEFGAVLTPEGKFLFDRGVEDDLSRWVNGNVRKCEREIACKAGAKKIDAESYKTWKEIDPTPMPIASAPPTAPVYSFDPAALRPGKKAADKKPDDKKPGRKKTAATIFD
jgi:hypothetical protein